MEAARPEPQLLSADSDFLSPVGRSEEHTSELQSQSNLVCRLLLEKKKPFHLRSRWMPFISFTSPHPPTQSPALILPVIMIIVVRLYALRTSAWLQSFNPGCSCND